jgi:hypothetical protein
VNKTQSKNPFRPNYVDPWYWKYVDMIPNWVALVGFVFIAVIFMSMILGVLRAIFCCC